MPFRPPFFCRPFLSIGAAPGGRGGRHLSVSRIFGDVGSVVWAVVAWVVLLAIAGLLARLLRLLRLLQLAVIVPVPVTRAVSPMGETPRTRWIPNLLFFLLVPVAAAIKKVVVVHLAQPAAGSGIRRAGPVITLLCSVSFRRIIQMLIDWLTISIPLELLTYAQLQRVESMADKIRRFCPSTGEVVWETTAWESVRSDSHQIAVKAGADALRIQGSPARCMGDGDAVFGHELYAMDIVECSRAMVDFAFERCDLGRFDSCIETIKISRIDVTGNLLLDSLAQVRQALAELRSVEGGRYRVSQTAGDTVYWSHRSRMVSAKAYAKGPHIQYMLKKPGYSGVSYGVDQQMLANRLLRLEVSLKSQFMREQAQIPWYEMDVDYLFGLWSQRYEKMVGSVDLMSDDAGGLKDRILASAKTPGQGKGAYLAWCAIEAHGWQWARDTFPKSTWYRHLQVLRAAGLGDADISAGKVVSLRRRPLALVPVQSWDDLRACG